jgi:hypothetical protein
MSEALQATRRELILTGLGYFPAFTPAHQPERLMGTNAGMFRFLSPTI